MELMVVIQVLEVFKNFCEVNLIIDFQYVCKGIIEWLSNWKKCNWQIVVKKLVVNKDFWQCLEVVVEWYWVNWYWVCGYSGYSDNECVDWFVNWGIDEVEIGV